MKLRFLCAAHRQQLTLKADQAVRYWQNGFDTGQLLYDQALWVDAIPHIGCAFETSEIILTKRAVDNEVACEWFTSSTLLLASTFVNLSYKFEAKHILWMGIDRLEKEIRSTDIRRSSINACLDSLYQQLNNLMLVVGEPTGIEGTQLEQPYGLFH